MAYKHAKGKVFRGDIYNEDDNQGNTYLDWDEDYLGVVTAGNTVLAVSGSSVGIGTATPDYTLDVAGNAGFDEYIYHKGDDDTFIRFQADEINIKAGDVNFISITEDTQNKIVFNDGAADVDFIVRSPNESKALYLNAANEVFHINHGDAGFKTKIHSTNGEAVTVNEFGVIINEEGHAVNDFRVETTANTHMFFIDAGSNEVGIGTSSPASTLDVSGSIGGSIDTITGTSNSIGDSHFTVLMNATAGHCAAQLPDVTICTGRIYTLKRVDSSANGVKVQSNGSDEIEGTTDDLELSNQYQACTLQSDGAAWWILADRNV